MAEKNVVSEKIVLHYWSFAGGRGEAIRIALHHAKVDFEDRWVGNPIPADLHSKVDMGDAVWAPFRLPILSIGGKDYTQSIAQLRFAGKKSNLYPRNHLAALAVDEILDTVQDCFTLCPQPAEVQTRQEFSKGRLKEFFDLFTQRIKEHGSGFMCGPDLTVGDLAAWAMLKTIRNGFWDYIIGSYPDDWPAIVEFERKLFEHPVVVDYYTSQGRPPIDFLA